MWLVLQSLLWLAAAAAILAVAVPVAVLVVQCLAAQLPAAAAPVAKRGRLAVLMPAHNEQDVIAATLASLRPQLRSGDRILVVADNCTDQTASVARDCGAVVVERADAERHGKGWALDFGCRALAEDPPEVVVIVDADCTASPNLLDQLASAAAAYGGPVQAAYEMPPPANPRAVDTLSSLSILIKNVVRPRGFAALGLPCLLNGSGMAVPWVILKDAPLAGGHIGEEYQLSIDLAIQGVNTRFLPTAAVYGPLPGQRDIACKQRRRWGHTQLQTMRLHVPRLLSAALRQRRLNLVALALEVAVPPLSLLLLAAAASLMLGIVAGAVTGHWWLAAVAAGLVVALFAAVLLAWFRFGRKTIPWTNLAGIVWYLVRHVPLYLVYFIRPHTQWTKTQRTAPQSSS